MPEEYWSQIYLKLTKDGVASEITAEIINFSQNPFYLQRDYSLLRRRRRDALWSGLPEKNISANYQHLNKFVH